MAEQPTNVLEFPMHRINEGTAFNDGDGLDLHASSLPRDVSDPEAMAREAVIGAYGKETLTAVQYNIIQARRVGEVLAAIRPKEIADDAARKAA